MENTREIMVVNQADVGNLIYTIRGQKVMTANISAKSRYHSLAFPEQGIYCDASSKDAGKKITSITKIGDTAIYHVMVDELLKNPQLTLN